MTDGVNNAGIIHPTTALSIAKTYGIKVYTIGIGTNGMAEMPYATNAFGEWQYRTEKVEIDEEILTQIATQTGGEYFRATNEYDLNKIYQAIDRLEKSDIQIESHTDIQELYTIPLGLALIFLFLYTLSKYTLVRSILDD
jgi:Ca-activated chloride channel family protein